eukprot:gene22049-30283_t
MDFAAGCTVFVLLIPQGMAYAILAGMPPVYGLYSATVPMLVYAALGTSREVSLGPMAITSLLLGVSCQRYGYAEGTNEYILLATNISMIVGIVLFLVGIFKLGALTNLISQSVLTGFLSASALVIALNQLKHVFGIPIPRFQYTHETVIYLFLNLDKTNLYALSLAIASLVFLYSIREAKRNKKLCGRKCEIESLHWTIRYLILGAMNSSNLIVIVIASTIARTLSLNGSYLPIVGDVPSGILPPSFQFLRFSQCIELVPTSLAIAFVSFAGNWAIAKKYATVNNYRVDATQEIIAYGVSNIVGVLFNSIVVSGGLARTAVNVESGARTQLSGCITAVLMILSLLLLTSFFYYVPMSVLGAIIIVSITSMVDFSEMVSAYRINKKDFSIMVSSFLVTLFVGVTDGLFVGILLSISLIFHSSAFPNIVHLGHLPESDGGHYKNISRFPTATQIPGIAIIRMDATLSFSNCEYFQKIVMEAAQGRYHTCVDVPIRKVILDVSAWIEVDLPGVKTLFDLHKNLQLNEVSLAIACAKGPLRDLLRNSNFIDLLGEGNLCMSIDEAVHSVHSVLSARRLAPSTSLLLASLPRRGLSADEEFVDNGNGNDGTMDADDSSLSIIRSVPNPLHGYGSPTRTQTAVYSPIGLRN